MWKGPQCTHRFLPPAASNHPPFLLTEECDWQITFYQAMNGKLSDISMPLLCPLDSVVYTWLGMLFFFIFQIYSILSAEMVHLWIYFKQKVEIPKHNTFREIAVHMWKLVGNMDGCQYKILGLLLCGFLRKKIQSLKIGFWKCTVNTMTDTAG